MRTDLVFTGEPTLIAFTIRCYVKRMWFLQLLTVLQNDIIPARGSARRLGGIVCVASRTIPVTRDWFGVK